MYKIKREIRNFNAQTRGCVNYYIFLERMCLVGENKGRKLHCHDFKDKKYHSKKDFGYILE